MAFDPTLIINSSDGGRGGFDKSGNFYTNNIVAGNRIINSAMNAKVGAVAGWTVRAANDLPLSTLAALLQSSSTLIIPITGLKVGDTIVGFSIQGQLDSAGATVTLDADLRKVTVAAAGYVDSSVGAITQVSATADTALSATNAGKTGLTDVVGVDESFYVKITGITGTSCTAEIYAVMVTTNWSA